MQLAKFVVPTLGDWCAVDILEEDGRFNRLAVVHSDPQKIELAKELEERYPGRPGVADKPVERSGERKASAFSVRSPMR